MSAWAEDIATHQKYGRSIVAEDHAAAIDRAEHDEAGAALFDLASTEIAIHEQEGARVRAGIHQPALHGEVAENGDCRNPAREKRFLGDLQIGGKRRVARQDQSLAPG